VDHRQIVTNPNHFRKAVLDQTSSSHIDKLYAGTLRVLLYLVWKGAFNSRAALVENQVDIDLGILCLSTYKAFIPIIQMIRLGYPSDAIILLRALMERIALLGYLNADRTLIPKYVEGDNHIRKDAMAWAKSNSLQNWMYLYSYLSNVAHSKPEGSAGHLFEDNDIGRAFREDLSESSKDGPKLTDELLGLVCYALLAADPIAVEILATRKFTAFAEDKKILMFINTADLKDFRDFLLRFIDKYK
jgi:hypothetical protein